MNVTPIGVDYREDVSTSVGLVDRLGAERVTPRVNHPFGDLIWATDQLTYGVELKSVSDFFASLWSGESGERLEWQLDGLRRLVDVPILGIHGLLIPHGAEYAIHQEPFFIAPHTPGRTAVMSPVLRETRMRVSSVEGFLASIVQQGVVVVYRPRKRDLLDALAAFYLESAKDERTTFNHHLTAGKVKDEDPQLSKFLTLLVGIDGLGEKRARELLKVFGTPSGVFNAEDKELMKVEGVGKTTVVKIREALG